MSGQKCYRCLKSDNVVRLLDAVYGNEIVKIYEECALIEDVPIIRRPTSFQLKESARPYTVSERPSRMSGFRAKGNETAKPRERAEEKLPMITLDKLRKPKDYREIIRKREEVAKKRNVPLELVDNFNWHIQMARRNRKMSLLQLGAIIGESEITLKMIEDGVLPDDAERIIGKIEQFFKIGLKKSSGGERMSSIAPPARILNFDEKSMSNLTIQDLRKLKEQKDRMMQEDADKDFASKVIWKGKSKEEREKDNETKEQPAEESYEEKKSRKSFWNLFKSNKNNAEDEEISLAEDVSSIDDENNKV